MTWNAAGIMSSSSYLSDCLSIQKHRYLRFVSFSLYIFYCHKLQQWGWVSSSRNISYDPPPTYTDQSKHVNMATKHIVNYTKIIKNK